MYWQQRAENKDGTTNQTGRLFVVPTPIGNLQDMTPRAIDVLASVDYVAAEDTRHTRRLLSAFQIQARLTSFFDHNQHRKTPGIIDDLVRGQQVAVVSDAGLPGISDPGQYLVEQALRVHIPVIALPGANAGITALVASGLASDRFLFYGFLSREAKQKKEELQLLQLVPYTLVFYESPHRLAKTLRVMHDIFGNRRAVLAKEISKAFETYIRGTISELQEWVDEENVRGEFTLLIEGASAAAWTGAPRVEEHPYWQQWSLPEHVDHYLQQGMRLKEACKQVANERKQSAREVYNMYHDTK